jgi:hypothetical protein
VLLLLVGAVVVVADRGWHAYQAYRRIDAVRAAPNGRDPANAPIQDWQPVRVVARAYRVPESVILDALRNAGFTVQAQAVAPDLPGALGRRAPNPPAPPSPPSRSSPAAPLGGRLLEPDRQSLRQIAGFSNREPREAVRVTEEAIRAYRQEHPAPPRPPGAPGAPGTPAGPRPDGGAGFGERGGPTGGFGGGPPPNSAGSVGSTGVAGTSGGAR